MAKNKLKHLIRENKMAENRFKHLIVLRPNYLKAMLLTTAKKDVRYYLMGVCFKAVNGVVWGLATDGHRLGRWMITDNYLGDDFEWIIGRDAIKQAIEWGGDIILETSNGALSVNNTSFCEVIDGLYPNALTLINTSLEATNDETANPEFQAKYIKDLAKITKLLSKGRTKPPRFIHVTRINKGSNVFIVVGVPDYVHIMMPLGDIIDKKDSQKFEQLRQQALMPADLPNPIHKLIDEGKFVRCGVSDISAIEATNNANARLLNTVVAYDETGYMDERCIVWKYVHFVEVVEDE